MILKVVVLAPCQRIQFRLGSLDHEVSHQMVVIIFSWACIETLFRGPPILTYLDIFCVYVVSRNSWFLWGGLVPQDILMVGVTFQKLLLATSQRPQKGWDLPRYLAQVKRSRGRLGSPWTQQVFVWRTFGWTFVVPPEAVFWKLVRSGRVLLWTRPEGLALNGHAGGNCVETIACWCSSSVPGSWDWWSEGDIYAQLRWIIGSPVGDI